jgi:hypothetical protein
LFRVIPKKLFDQLVKQSEGSCNMADQEDQIITRDMQTIPVKRAEQFVEIYANYVSLSTAAWNVTVMFGRAVTDDPNNPYIEQRLSAALSPQTAKALMHLLQRNIATYEQQYGEIRYIPLPQSTEEPST